MFWIVLLFFSLLSAESGPSPIAHFETGLPCIAGGFVNVITGAPLIEEEDLVIPGVESLSFSRSCYYSPSELKTQHPWTGGQWNQNLSESISIEQEEGIKEVRYETSVDNQKMLSFSFPGRGKGEQSQFDLLKDGKGSTNLSHGFPSGRFNLKNITLKRVPPSYLGGRSATLISGSGEQKDFFGVKTRHQYGDVLYLQQTKTPSGFKKKFHWDACSLHSVDLETPSGKKIGEISIKNESFETFEKVTASTSDRRTTALTFTKDKRGYRDQLVFVDRSDLPPTQYTYLSGLHHRRLESISLPSNRGVKFTYWASNDRWIDNGRHAKLSKEASQLHKIKTIEQPVGPGPEKIATHLIQYFRDQKSDWAWKLAKTQVVSSEGHIDDYFFGTDYLLKEVYHYSSLVKTSRVDFAPFPLNHVCDLREKFHWNEGGEIREKIHCDGFGNPLRTLQYEYDTRGNVTAETFIGNLSGKSDQESHIKRSTFSEDGFNLLLTEVLPSGLEVHYRYKSGTNLLTSRITLSNGKIVREELFAYDEDHCLIRSEDKSAFLHRVEKVTPSKETPFGYPLEKNIYGVTSKGEILLETFVYRYDGRGNVVFEERRDKEGQPILSIRREFDPHGNCLFEEDSLGRKISKKFDLNDNCVEEAGPRVGFTKFFSYDFMNRCVEEKVHFGSEKWVAHHSYNHLSQKVKSVDFFGYTNDTVFDRYGRALEITLPEIKIEEGWKRPVVRKKYDPFGNEIETADPLGHVTYKKFTAKDKPYQVVHPDGSMESIEYSMEGLPLSVKDEDGVVTSFTYDPMGRVVSKETPHGVETYLYEGLYLVQKVDREGVVTTFSYDPFGRLEETVTDKRREVLSYDEMSHPYRKAHYEGETLLSTEVSRIDPLGRTTELYLEDPSGQIFNHQRFVYDEAGNCILEQKGCSITRRTFDGLNRIVEVIDDDQNTHKVIYSQTEHEERTIQEKIVVDPNGQQIITLFDPCGKEFLIKHLNAFGFEIRRKEITYDLAGNIVKEETVSDTEKRTLLKEVDTRGRVITLIEPLKKVTRMSYTAGGKLAVLTKPDGIQLSHGYVDGRLSSLVSSDGTLSYHYTYNRRGELIAVYDGITGQESLQTFSPLGELIEETLPLGQKIAYTYDGLGRMTSYSLPDGGQALLTYNAKAATSLTRLDHHGKRLYEHRYTAFDDLGNVLEEELIGNGGKVSFTFDNLYQLKSIEHPHFSQKEFTYDPAGNLISYEKKGEKLSFKYDDLYQLIREKDHQYTYDPFHNRRSKDEDPYDVNELDQLLSRSDHTYTYDPNGNLLKLENSQETLHFTYDALNRLTSITKGEEKAVFTYDPFHRRLSRNGIPFHFCREQEIGFENELRLLGPGLGGDIGAAVALEFDGTPCAPLHDHQGSIIALMDLDGNLNSSWGYTAYGEIEGECLSPWGFSSKRQEPLTGWISFGRRDYDPLTGRWTTPDPLGFEAGPNLYTYVFNRPLTHRDPLGLIEEPIRNLMTRAERKREGVKEFFFNEVIMDHVDRIHMIMEAGFELGERIFGETEKHYPRESYLYEICDLENLPPESVVVVYTNGICTSAEDFEINCRYLSSMGFNVVGIYNPFHGNSLGHKIQDGYRALSGVRGNPDQKIIRDFTKHLDTIFSKAPKDTQLLLCPHSEGNVVAATALENYYHNLDRIAYLGVCPAKYLEKGIVRESAYLMTTNDFIPWVDKFGRRNTEPTRIYIAENPSYWEFDHSFQSPTLKPHLQKGIENYIRDRKFSFR